MTSDKLMKEYLDQLSVNPLPIYEICEKMHRPEGNVRRVLKAMVDLGLVEKVPICIESPGKKPRTVGWRKKIIG